LRWAATIGVMFHHSDFHRRYSPHTSSIITSARMAAGWVVLFFFMAAGYVTRDTAALGRFIRKRAVRLLIPYVLVSVISFSIVWVLGRASLYSVSGPDDRNIPSLIANLARGLGYGPQLYFLPYLFVISVADVVLARVMPVWVLLSLLATLLTIQCIWLGPPDSSIGPGPDRWLLYAVAFCGGLFFQQILREIPPQPPARWRRRSLVVISLLSVVGVALAARARIGFVLNLCIPIWLYMALKRAEGSGWIPKTVSSAGTGAIYLWHTPIILPACAIVLMHLGVRDLANWLVALPLTIIICLAIHRALRAMRAERLLSL
jgi:Acyltransferase family